MNFDRGARINSGNQHSRRWNSEENKDRFHVVGRNREKRCGGYNLHIFGWVGGTTRSQWPCAILAQGLFSVSPARPLPGNWWWIVSLPTIKTIMCSTQGLSVLPLSQGRMLGRTLSSAFSAGSRARGYSAALTKMLCAWSGGWACTW